MTAYDDRPEREKEIWDLRKMNVKMNGTSSSYLLDFTQVKPPWLHEMTKRFMYYRLAVYSPGDCLNKMHDLGHFFRFLSASLPIIQPSNLNRALMVEYIGYLRSLPIQENSANKYLASVHTFLETCAYRLQVPGLTRERLIFEEDFPKGKRRSHVKFPRKSCNS